LALLEVFQRIARFNASCPQQETALRQFREMLTYMIKTDNRDRTVEVFIGNVPSPDRTITKNDLCFWRSCWLRNRCFSPISIATSSRRGDCRSAMNWSKRPRIEAYFSGEVVLVV